MERFHAYMESPVGAISIWCTDTHVAAITFTDEPLGKNFSLQTNDISRQVVQQLTEYFRGARRNFSFPLQQSGTAFQEKVWQLLYAIPFGKTVSYATLARQYGNLKAIRAVAAANGRNRLSIVVPCHRVIGTNQALTGYAGGLWRKKWLLEHEAKHFAGVQQLF